MKIDYCITEQGMTGKFLVNEHPHMRVLETQIYTWDAFVLPIDKVLTEDTTYEGNVVVALPKGDMEKQIIHWLVKTHFNAIQEIKKKFSGKVLFYQDGEVGYWNQHDTVLQIWWYNNVSACDKILCPNLSDVNYYKGMFKNIPVSVVRSIMLPQEKKNLKQENKAIISGPFTREYNGLQQTIIAKEFDCGIYIPPMGKSRMPKDSWETAPAFGVNYLEYVDWKTWIQNLQSYKYAVNLPGTSASASFSLNCAYYGIPCIGEIKADTQRLCYPELSVQTYDIQSAIQLARKLKEDKEFYIKCSQTAKRVFKEEFSQKKFLEVFKDEY
jgi:hypothetical protein